MKKFIVFFVFVVLALAPSAVNASSLTDQEIKQKIISQSISEYPGTCACPYNRARNGSKCGKRSAYSKPGGYSPLCYEGDVTDQMIQDYKDQKLLGQ